MLPKSPDPRVGGGWLDDAPTKGGNRDSVFWTIIKEALFCVSVHYLFTFGSPYLLWTREDRVVETNGRRKIEPFKVTKRAGSYKIWFGLVWFAFIAYQPQ